MCIGFEWDEHKNRINVTKHRVSFEEALTVFADEEALVIPDDAHSTDEERFVILGMSYKANILLVCHCYRESASIIRIISARRATERETRQYLSQRKG